MLPGFLDSRRMKVVGCQPYAPAAFTPQERSLVNRHQGHSVARRVKSMKKDSIENQTHDLPECSALSQSTALPRAHKMFTT